MRAPATADEQKKVDAVYQIYAQCSLYRVNFESQWDEVAQLIAPNYRNTFRRENYNFPGEKKTQVQVDASGMVANAKFAAICDSMITPFSSQWHGLEASDPNLKKNREVRLWFEEVTRILFDLRYMAAANFREQNQQIFQLVGAFGNGPMFIDQLYDMHDRPTPGIRYAALPIGEVYIRTNHQGRVDAFVRAYRMTARQAKQKWGEDMLSEELHLACEKNSEVLYDFFHCVYPNPDYDPRRTLSVEGRPFISHYVSCSGRRLMQEGGYFSFPLAMARYTQAPNEVYGRGPAMNVLPALKTLNAEKSTFLKAGHRAADPVLLTVDDGLTDFSLVPGSLNKGGMSSDGKRLVDALQPGDIQITKEMMDEERLLLGDMFLTTIFQTLVENPNMTATQVIELINQKGIFLAPTVGGMGPGYLEPMIEREIDLAQQQSLLPPMPPLLREAKGQYKIVHTSPLYKAANAGKASGWLRTVQSSLEVAAQTADPSHLDWMAGDRAWPEIARIQDSPEAWISSEGEMAAKRQARAQAQALQAQIQAMPAQAAMVKAEATARKAGAQAA